MAGTVIGKNAENINDFLKRYKQVKINQGLLDQNGNPVQSNWQDYTPSTLTYQKPADTGVLSSINDEISNRDTQVTNTAVLEAQNRKNQELYRQQLAMFNTAKRGQVQKLTADQVQAAASQDPLQGGKSAPSVASQFNSSGTPSPKGMTTITSHGHNVTVNAAVAGRFKGFLDALWSKGYHFKSVGGYANRDIHTGPAAGKGVQSLHALGYAIDIDPSSNPTSPIKKSGQYVYALPPSVGALAAKYGLHWGGNWHTYKDFMHFSVPYGGRE